MCTLTRYKTLYLLTTPLLSSLHNNSNNKRHRGVTLYHFLRSMAVSGWWDKTCTTTLFSNSIQSILLTCMYVNTQFHNISREPTTLGVSALSESITTWGLNPAVMSSKPTKAMIPFPRGQTTSLCKTLTFAAERVLDIWMCVCVCVSETNYVMMYICVLEEA